LSGWFKHDGNASEDPFMKHLEHHFGNDGYAVFFKILELMTDNFNPNAVGKLKTNWKQMRNKTSLKSLSLKRIFDFINKKRKMLIDYDDDEIYIYCENYQRRMSPYAHRLLRQKVSTNFEGSAHTKKNMYSIRIEKNRKNKRGTYTKRWGIFHIKDVLKKLKLGKGEKNAR